MVAVAQTEIEEAKQKEQLIILDFPDASSLQHHALDSTIPSHLLSDWSWRCIIYAILAPTRSLMPSPPHSETCQGSRSGFELLLSTFWTERDVITHQLATGSHREPPGSPQVLHIHRRSKRHSVPCTPIP
eukprot:3479965-Rhodomonas_salina.1